MCRCVAWPADPQMPQNGTSMCLKIHVTWEWTGRADGFLLGVMKRFKISCT